MPKFVNRERELAALERAVGAQPGLAVLSGRRRVGKTALLDRFAHDRRAVFLPGTRAPVAEALRRLEERVRLAAPPLPGDLLDLGHLESWDAALGYLLARARDEPLLVVLDEFPYLCETDPALPSTLQARWDHRGESRLSLVLAGSHVGLMEELVTADAPLFGRADAHLRLAPFGWREAGLLVGGDEPAAWLEAYVTVGGMPRYLALWDPRMDARTNLTDALDGPGAPLGDEGTVVLQELAPGSAAARVLELVALGADTFTAVRERAGLAPASTSEALGSLESLGLIERHTPVSEDPRRTRRVRYTVRDPFLRIWLGVVQPHREAFELGRGTGVLAAAREELAVSQALTLKAVARDWVGEREQATCGPWWPAGGGQNAVDALVLRGGAAVAAASAVWATGVDGNALRQALRAALATSPHHTADTLYVVARDGEQVLTPADLYQEAPAPVP
ncbi:MAG: ATP-binding protein [Nitriliruptorales bacterium]|nr:ATP-binding protein [Nitriliruptorales bacterium]